MALIDSHTHLLPMIDDGVQKEEKFFELLEAYEKHGFSKVVSTIHLYNPYVATKTEDIKEKSIWAKEAAKKYNIDFEVGSETFIGSTQEVLVIPFLDNCVLIETDTFTEPLFLIEHVKDLIKLNYKVILAHVERYRWFNLKNHLVKALQDYGVFFQCNVEGIEDGSSSSYLKADVVDVIASDNHGDVTLPRRLVAQLEKYPKVVQRMDNLFR
ncbi:MAG: CpsB/CapC family capsule biosynthesis tyrosine phosphatase [Sphaerochaetaceae bacterium]